MCSMEIMSIPSISKVVRGWHLESGMDPTRSVSFLVPSVGYSLFFFTLLECVGLFLWMWQRRSRSS